MKLMHMIFTKFSWKTLGPISGSHISGTEKAVDVCLSVEGSPTLSVSVGSNASSWAIFLRRQPFFCVWSRLFSVLSVSSDRNASSSALLVQA